MALRKLQEAQILRLTSENKFVFHLNMNVQDILRLVLFFIVIQTNLGNLF